MYSTPFSSLLHFAKDTGDARPACARRRTALRATSRRCCATRSRTLLADFDVYLTDWHNARDVPLDEGPFGFDEYVDDTIRVADRISGRGST